MDKCAYYSSIRPSGALDFAAQSWQSTRRRAEFTAGSDCCVSSPNFEQTRNREEAMKNHRRTFLKGAGLAGVAIAAGGVGRAGRPGIVIGTAQAASSQSGELPKGMTFTMLRRADGYGLGVRTERGI